MEKKKKMVLFIVILVIMVITLVVALKLNKTNEEKKANTIINNKSTNMVNENTSNNMTENTKKEEKTEKKEEKDSNISTTDKSENKKTDDTNTSVNSTQNTTVSKTNDNDATKKETNVNSDLVGKWNTVKVKDMSSNMDYDNLKELYGSSYLEYGSYLQLNSDGTFIDGIQPITDGSESKTGKYEVLRDYNKKGDCYIDLTYSDGRKQMIQKVYLDETENQYLTFDSNNMYYELKK